jgi:hypothetical protein
VLALGPTRARIPRKAEATIPAPKCTTGRKGRAGTLAFRLPEQHDRRLADDETRGPILTEGTVSALRARRR